MPIYEYQCPQCGVKTEELVASFSAPAPKCPQCGVKTEKMLSTFAASVGGSDSFFQWRYGRFLPFRKLRMFLRLLRALASE